MPALPNFSPIESSNQQQAESLSPLHTVIISLLTTLGGYLQVQYQSKNISPFDDHANVMLAIFVTLSIYAVGLIAEFKLRTQLTYLPLIKRFIPLTGILLVVLLLIILFPLLGIVAFITWALFMLEALMRLFLHIFQCLRHIYSCVNGSTRSNLDEEESHSLGNEEVI